MTGCGPRRISLPGDPGTPLADFQTIHGQVSAACGSVRSLTAELGLSGRAGEQRLRGRVIAGFEAPGSMRLEATAPFGQPMFILAARGPAATLWLPRQEQVVRNASAEAILRELTGVPFGAADLQAILTGCVLPAPRAATAGRLHSNGWASIDIAATPATTAAATLYLRRSSGRWVVVAARRGAWEIEYAATQSTLPAAVRLRSEGTATGTRVDITAALSQIETNVSIDPAAFTVDVPADARLLGIEDLRRSGLLRGN